MWLERRAIAPASCPKTSSYNAISFRPILRPAGVRIGLRPCALPDVTPMSTGTPNKNRWRARALAGLFSLYGAWAAADPTLVVPPLPLPGPYPVACSNVAAGLYAGGPRRKRAGLLGRDPPRRRQPTLHHRSAGRPEQHAGGESGCPRQQHLVRDLRRREFSLCRHRLLSHHRG